MAFDASAMYPIWEELELPNEDLLIDDAHSRQIPYDSFASAAVEINSAPFRDFLDRIGASTTPIVDAYMRLEWVNASTGQVSSKPVDRNDLECVRNKLGAVGKRSSLVELQQLMQNAVGAPEYVRLSALYVTDGQYRVINNIQAKRTTTRVKVGNVLPILNPSTRDTRVFLPVIGFAKIVLKHRTILQTFREHLGRVNDIFGY